jgi:diacylglycerol O-acyltransferase / wax synthase
MEALMWRLEQDRALSATFGSITFLDREPDPKAFRARLLAAVKTIPRLRQRIEPSALPLTAPRWVDHQTFSLDDHLRWQPCPGQGTESDVLDVAAALVAEPFEPGLPLWTFVVVTGLADGRAALVQRMHHALTDGKGGIRLSEQFIDLERAVSPLPPDPFPGEESDEPAPLEPTWSQRAAMAATERVSEAARATTGIARWAAGGVGNPGRFAELGADVVETAQSLRRQVAVIDAARSPLWTDRSTGRRVVVGSIPFDPIRAAATTFGVSVNDIFVTATLRGAASYHRIHGQPVSELRVAIPVSTRSDGIAGGNAFSPTREVLNSGDELTAPAHLRTIAAILDRTKRERATTLIEPLAAAAELMPTPLLCALMRRQAATIDYTASNLRAAPFALYIGGAAIEATYAIGPLAATAANVTMMTYNGRIDLGVHVDTGAVADPELLRDTIIGAFHEVCEGANALA